MQHLSMRFCYYDDDGYHFNYCLRLLNYQMEFLN